MLAHTIQNETSYNIQHVLNAQSSGGAQISAPMILTAALIFTLYCILMAFLTTATMPLLLIFGIQIIIFLATITLLACIIFIENPQLLKKMFVGSFSSHTWIAIAINILIGLSSFIAIPYVHLIFAMSFRLIATMTNNKINVIISKTKNHNSIPYFFNIFVATPIIEECFFRGILQSFLKKYFHAHFAAIIHSIIFAIMHLSILYPLVVNIPIFCTIFSLSIFFSILYETTGSLIPSIMLHVMYNIFCYL